MHTEHNRPRRAWLRLEKLVFLALVLVCAWWGVQYLPMLAQWDVGQLIEMKRAHVVGEPVYASRKLAERRLAKASAGGIMNADLRALEELLQTDPWVARATAELVWPFGLKVRLVEHKVAARWGDGSLLSTDGVVFTPQVIPDAVASRELPTLYSEVQNAQSAGPSKPLANRPAELLALFTELQAALSPTERRIVMFRENAQFSVSMWLDDGVQIAVGRKDQLVRVRRIAEVYPVFFADKRKAPAYIDLRYPTSVAVRYANKNS